MMRAPSRWFEIDLAAISFGQAVSVSALQLTTATAAIANGGLLMQPYLVEQMSRGGSFAGICPRSSAGWCPKRRHGW